MAGVRPSEICMATFVLVPGAWLGGWVWKKVVPLLHERGHEVHVITLTGMGERVHLASKEVGIETAIQDVLNVITYNDLNDFVLVGHSFAGKVVAAVADRVPEKVRTLLYLDAFRPQRVRTPQGSFDPNEFGSLKPGEWTIPLTEEILDNIGKDVKGPDRKWLLSKATPWPMKHSTEPVTLSKNFDTVKSAYIFCTGGGDPVDEILKGKWGKLDGPHKVIESGHYPMITKPDELVEDMLILSG
jgi:pimeloyl-ACP methyl ester carboxylesterase